MIKLKTLLEGTYKRLPFTKNELTLIKKTKPNNIIYNEIAEWNWSDYYSDETYYISLYKEEYKRKKGHAVYKTFANIEDNEDSYNDSDRILISPPFSEKENLKLLQNIIKKLELGH